ncbi:hypothetical protein BY458DRAFT_553633 [Sporodiniella umbellata]|nr:hypothetical protein BY458DRAFT_553633 [Sporodiniella umbellata]
MDIIYLNNFSFLSATSLLLFVVYLGYVRYHRYAHLKHLIEKYPDPDIILKDHDIAFEIYGAIHHKEFPFSTRMALAMTLIKPLAVSSISDMLSKTRKSTEHANHRFGKTTVDVHEFLEPQARIQKVIQEGLVLSEKTVLDQNKRRENSFKRINSLHSKYRATNEEYLYTLYIFAIEKIRWIELCGWRKLDIRELNAIYKVWHEIGTSLHFKNIPPTIKEWEDQMMEYGKKNSDYRPCQWDIGHRALDYLVIELPKPFKKIVYYLFPCTLEDYECDSFGIPKPSPLKLALFKATMRLRGLYVRYLCLPRKVYRVHTFLDRHHKTDLLLPDSLKNQKDVDKYNNEKTKAAVFVPMCPHLQTINKL